MGRGRESEGEGWEGKGEKGCPPTEESGSASGWE